MVTLSLVNPKPEVSTFLLKGAGRCAFVGRRILAAAALLGRLARGCIRSVNKPAKTVGRESRLHRRRCIEDL